MKIELFAEKAPITVENFLAYVDDGFYEGTIFHRVISDFVIQGGGFTEDMQKKKTLDPIKNEATNGLKNEKYTLSMARTPNPDSATSQFFINLEDNVVGGKYELDPYPARAGYPASAGYAVFGKVIEGTETVEKIRSVKTGRVSYYKDVPTEPIVIEKMTLVEADEEKAEVKKAEDK